MYPTYFEGEETDSRIFYCGAAPNQYIADYLTWVAETLGGRRVYVVGGSDYIYPRVLAEAIRRLSGGQVGIDIVGDRYTPLGETRFESIVDDIREQQPSVVICNLVGADSTTAFYTQFHLAGFTSESTPIAATVTTELDLAHMPAEVSDGHYMVATYFSDLASPPVNSSYRRELLEARGQRWSHSARSGPSTPSTRSPWPPNSRGPWTSTISHAPSSEFDSTPTRKDRPSTSVRTTTAHTRRMSDVPKAGATRSSTNSPPDCPIPGGRAMHYRRSPIASPTHSAR